MTYNTKPRQVLQIPLDKLLFAIASLYFGLTVFWLCTQQNKQQTNAAPVNTEISPANEEFTAYLEKSLATVERKTAAKVTKPSPQPTTVSPVIRVAPPPPPPMTNTPPVERIYIPVYPQNPSFTPTKPQKVTKSPIPPPPPVVTVAPSAIPAPPFQSNFTGGKLVGVLELGDRSSALFDVNGLTKRIAIGENVSGWVLLKIQNQQVFLHQGSNTRVLDLGQSL